MNWTKIGQLYGREYRATGFRGAYKIDLDMPEDRWAIYLNDARLVENVYYEKSAERIAERFDATADFLFAVDERLRKGGGVARAA